MYGFKVCVPDFDPEERGDLTEFLTPHDMASGGACAELAHGLYGFHGPWGWAPLADCVDDAPVASKEAASKAVEQRQGEKLQAPVRAIPAVVEEVVLQCVSAAVKAAREAAGLSADMVALVSGLPRERVLAIEGDETTARSMTWVEISGLSIALGVEPSAFLPMAKVSTPKGAA